MAWSPALSRFARSTVTVTCFLIIISSLFPLPSDERSVLCSPATSTSYSLRPGYKLGCTPSSDPRRLARIDLNGTELVASFRDAWVPDNADPVTVYAKSFCPKPVLKLAMKDLRFGIVAETKDQHISASAKTKAGMEATLRCGARVARTE